MAETLKRLLTAAMLAASLYLIVNVAEVEHWDLPLWAVLLVLCLDVSRDRTEESWFRFLPVGLILLAVSFFIYKQAADAWWKVAEWQMSSVFHLVNWDKLFARIPLNDPSFLRAAWEHPWVTRRLTWVYNFGFSFCIWAAVIRSFLARDWRKMLHYTLTTHVLQTPLIIPFYNSIELHEVWWVLGRPDLLGRPAFMDAYHLKLNAQNCFPSMHTSIAFAVMLLALRERGALFKGVMAVYTAAMIFSTLYLEIHWTIDVLAGFAFGYGAVKVSDWIMVKIHAGAVDPAGAPAPAPVQSSA